MVVRPFWQHLLFDANSVLVPAVFLAHFFAKEAHHALPAGRNAAVRILGQSVPPPMAEWAARLILNASPEDEPLADPRRHRVTAEKLGRGVENDPGVVKAVCAVMTRSMKRADFEMEDNGPEGIKTRGL